MTKIEENIKRIRFVDNSNYDSDKANNGGCYGFWTDYRRIGIENWELSFGTTADFSFCPCCGQFADHYNSDKESYTCGGFIHVAESKLLDIINNFEKTESEYIKYFN